MVWVGDVLLEQWPAVAMVLQVLKLKESSVLDAGEAGWNGMEWPGRSLLGVHMLVPRPWRAIGLLELEARHLCGLDLAVHQ